MAQYRLKRGYDIPLAGEASGEVVAGPVPERVALKPVEYRGIKPRLAVEEGDSVKVGSPLVFAKGDETHVFTSPVSGKVVAVERGHRRVINQVIVENDGKNEAVAFTKVGVDQLRGMAREDVLAQVKQSGVLPVFVQRPFGSTADPNVTPRDIFVAGFDSSPLAMDSSLQVKEDVAAYKAGLVAASRLTTGKVHVSVDGRRSDVSAMACDDPNVLVHSIAGPHPSGNVGTMVHLVKPVKNRHDIVWTTNVAGIMMLGRLFLEGRYAPERLVAVAGTGATERRIYRSLLGASVKSLVGAKVIDKPVRYISGNVLTGRKTTADGYLGFHDTLLTVIPEADEAEFIGWMLPGLGKGSWSRAYLSFLKGGAKVERDTRLGGGYRAMVATGVYEQVTPMDIMPMFLIKSILAEDFEEMEGLGIYEVLEEDLALCEYICPSKTEMQQIVRQGLDLVEKEG